MKITLHKPLVSMHEALNKYVNFIAPTYGPAGKKILIALSDFNIKAVDDGHEASKQFELENEFENAIISYIKEATEKTNNRVGDGTTTAVILTGAIVNEVMKEFNDVFSNTNYAGKVKEIQMATKEAIDFIRSKAKKIKTKEELYKVAYNSYNNEEIARLISSTLHAIGENGSLAIEDSPTSQTEVEIVKGIEIKKGFLSPYLINAEKEEVVLREPVVILINKRIDSFMEIVPLIKKIIDSGKRDIFLIADGFNEQVVTEVILSKIKGVFSPLLIEIPNSDAKKVDFLEDIAAVTGAKVIDPQIISLNEVDIAYAGKVKKVTASKDKTTLIDGLGTKEEITKRVALLTKHLESASTYDKQNIQLRIAALSEGIALIKVGAHTENEQKAIKAKVEDSINATRIAFKDGIVKGAGKMYEDIKTSSIELNNALKAPAKQLQENGKEYLDENVTDPAGVLIAALETASSIACGLLTIGGIIATKREKQDKVNNLDY